MNLRAILFALGCLGWSLAALAQQPATDVLLLTTGQEVAGRVLTITPTELTYLPANAAPPADTLHVPTASVFLVRYANGTREVLAPPAPDDPSPPALRGLGSRERQSLGAHDALRYYRASGPFWGTFGSALYLGPVLGLAPAIGISSVRVRPSRLQAPQPLLLQDADYARGYQQQANRTKRGHTWAGYGVAAGVYLALFAAFASGGL